ISKSSVFNSENKLFFSFILNIDLFTVSSPIIVDKNGKYEVTSPLIYEEIFLNPSLPIFLAFPVLEET
ncbi:hypothetical protein CP02DC14_1831, partial [Chlamydia psittaci 02DC14]